MIPYPETLGLGIQYLTQRHWVWGYSTLCRDTGSGDTVPYPEALPYKKASKMPSIHLKTKIFSEGGTPVVLNVKCWNLVKYTNMVLTVAAR